MTESDVKMIWDRFTLALSTLEGTKETVESFRPKAHHVSLSELEKDIQLQPNKNGIPSERIP